MFGTTNDEMKTHAAADMVVRVPRHGTIQPPPAVLEAAKKLVESEGGTLKAEETVDPHSPEGEGVVSTINCVVLPFPAQCLHLTILPGSQ